MVLTASGNTNTCGKVRAKFQHDKLEHDKCLFHSLCCKEQQKRHGMTQPFSTTHADMMLMRTAGMRFVYFYQETQFLVLQLRSCRNKLLLAETNASFNLMVSISDIVCW